MTGDPEPPAPARPVEPDAHPAVTLQGPRPGPIQHDDSLAAAGRKAMWLHVERLLELDAALLDPNALHDLKRYRVATRRLRAALRAFRDGFPGREVADLRSRLADLATAAGLVRDLDVRIGDVTHWAMEREPDTSSEIAPLVNTWTRDRDAATLRLEAHLRTRRHQRLLEDLVAFVEASGAEPGRDAHRPIGLHAGSLAFDAYERLVTYDRAVPWADLSTLHAIRIEAKRLRYLLEFLVDVLGPQQAGLVTRLVALQDHLGALHDAAINADAVRAILQAPAPLTPPERTAIGAYLVDRERAVARLRRLVGRPWRPIASVTFARALGRAVTAR